MRILKKSGFTLIEALIVFAIITIVISLLAPSGIWVRDSKAIRALENQGFKDIRIVGHNYYGLKFRGAEKGETVRFIAEATNSAGKRVTVYVYAGFWKGAAIRTP